MSAILRKCVWCLASAPTDAQIAHKPTCVDLTGGTVIRTVRVYNIPAMRAEIRRVLSNLGVVLSSENVLKWANEFESIARLARQIDVPAYTGDFRADTYSMIMTARAYYSLARELASDEPTCEGCGDAPMGACSEYVVTDHDGKIEHVMYCSECAMLARGDWNGTTASIVAVL